MSRENFLFSDTIAHNIAFGVDDTRDIERAASLADVGTTLWTSRMATDCPG